MNTTAKNELLKKLHAEVLDQFKNRCGKCFRSTIHVHEIIPRTAGQIAYDPENMIPLCLECHDWIHSQGAETQIEWLRKRRQFALAIIQQRPLTDVET